MQPKAADQKLQEEPLHLGPFGSKFSIQNIGTHYFITKTKMQLVQWKHSHSSEAEIFKTCLLGQ
jgi:hypothetical protein